MRPTPLCQDDPTTPPECEAECRYRQKFNGFTLQRNALRSELATMVDPYRCGWNLKPGKMGGHPLDYAPCIWRGGK